MEPKQKRTFIRDGGGKVYDLEIAAGAKLNKDAEFQRQAAEAVLPGWVGQVESAYASNDPALMVEAFGWVTGNVGLEVASCVLPGAK